LIREARAAEAEALAAIQRAAALEALGPTDVGYTIELETTLAAL